VDELLTRLNDGGIYAQGYADGICLLAVGRFPNTVSGLIQWALLSVKGWCGEHGLTVNPGKTGLVAFTRKRILPGFFEPRLFGETLQCSKSTKYLGVILDAQLTWKEHIEAKVGKARNMMWACRRACGRRWGLRPRVVYWLYTSVVRPSITYASLVWWPGCETARSKQLLGTIQRLACLGITGAMCTTPTGAMEALVDLPPLDLVVQSEARASAHRLWSLGSWSYLHPNHGHSRILGRLQQSDPIFNMRVDVMKPTYNFECKYRVVALTREDWISGTGTSPSVTGRVCFPDGSWMRGGGTRAGVLGHPQGKGLSFPLGRYATVFQAKVFAILACVHDIQSHGTPEKHIFSLIVWQPSRLWGLLEQRPHWFANVRRH
jgi:hypothetical protein